MALICIGLLLRSGRWGTFICRWGLDTRGGGGGELSNLYDALRVPIYWIRMQSLLFSSSIFSASEHELEILLLSGICRRENGHTLPS